MIKKRQQAAKDYGITTNLDQALDSLGADSSAQALHLTRSLDEAIDTLGTSRAFKPPQPEEETIEATVRPAQGREDLESVYRLVHDAYVEQGYIEAQPDGRLLHNSDLDNIPETVVLLVEVDKHLLGTVSLTVDGQFGLPVDKDFKATCDVVRNDGRALAGVWRLVTRHGYVDERRLVMSLIGEVVRQAIEGGVQTCLCAVNTKHEHFYKRLLNMQAIAYCRAVKRFHNVPGVCMRCDVESLPEWWKR